MKELKTVWTGLRPCVMHNGDLADPTNPIVRRIKAIVSKGSKKLTDADYMERDHLEWQGGLYYDAKAGRPYMPSDNLERAIQQGAQKSRLGKDVLAAVWVQDEIVHFEYSGPKAKDAMYADPRFTLRKGIVIQKSRLIRVRPMIPSGWKLSFTLEFDDGVINASNLKQAIIDAGALCGLGDHRPKFGRFLAEFP